MYRKPMILKLNSFLHDMDFIICPYFSVVCCLEGLEQLLTWYLIYLGVCTLKRLWLINAHSFCCTCEFYFCQNALSVKIVSIVILYSECLVTFLSLLTEENIWNHVRFRKKQYKNNPILSKNKLVLKLPRFFTHCIGEWKAWYFQN